MLISLNEYKAGLFINPEQISSIELSKGKIKINMAGDEDFTLEMKDEDIINFCSHFAETKKIEAALRGLK